MPAGVAMNFLLCLPQNPAADACNISNLIIETCKNANINDIPISISVGCACKTSQHQVFSVFLKGTEDKMYKHKLMKSRSAARDALLKTLAVKSCEKETPLGECRK